MILRIVKLITFALVLVVGCQPPTEMAWDNLTGSVVGEVDPSMGYIEVFSSPIRYSSTSDYSADYVNIYASTYASEDGSYTLVDGFPSVLMLNMSLMGCSNDDGRVNSVNTQPFVLSFVHASIDTYSVLIMDTTHFGRDYFPDADTNTIDQVLLGNNDIFGEPGTVRTIPKIVLY